MLVGVLHYAILVLSECKCLTWSCCFSWFWWTGDVEIAMHKGRLGEISTPQSKIPLSQSLEWPDITHIKNYMSLCLRHQPLHLFSNYHLCLNNTLDDYISNSEFVISIIDLPFFLQLIKSAAPKANINTEKQSLMVGPCCFILKSMNNDRQTWLQHLITALVLYAA